MKKIRAPRLIPEWQQTLKKSAVVWVSIASSLLTAAPLIIPQLQLILDPVLCLKITCGIFALIPILRIIQQKIGAPDDAADQ
ncbi:hypothetical protein [Agrobacterium vitis]|uniref:DUF7940 domain-containing protein n=1 Tax=Agrobacterium vitis TaxID=373 RepID=UPI0008724329|nr:hypothetical protein [Agrobacterium vitis]MCM2451932.1 hypothetical protein [Agrobacterium vitis]MCM2471120.1 hypothetical protein [Agrobacterium vitis]MUO70113.1 hypothetical protein [Agrobacterium vitis]MUO85566.1 hypothetical protein [Agrobacterium vitis]